MNAPDAMSLLAEYSRKGSEIAFREIVERYLDLVYSTALRMVGSDTHRARDISQIVFLDLARKASQISPNVMLGGWLHRHTCFVALNIIRKERRRQIHEQQAVEMNTLNDTSDYSALAPVLDQAINELEESDRTAVLLRFFEQCDFRSVGQQMGTTEDAARMRVNRALERLHAILKHHGITTAGATLAVFLTANAIHAAPVGLAATISLAVGSATAAVTTAAATSKIIIMTTIQKITVGTVLIAMLGISVFEAQQASTARADLETLRSTLPQVQELARRRNVADTELVALRLENTELKLSSNELGRIRAELRDLRQKAAEHPQPNTRIAEAEQPPVDEAESARQIDELVAGKEIIIRTWLKAFFDYAKEHNGDCPPTFDDARKYLPSTASDISNTGTQFELLYHGSLDEVKDNDIIVFREKNLWQHIGGKWGRFYGIANGSPQYCSSSDKSFSGSFDQYENEHLAH
jgi:RNA polymerase sigma factor (sigma-70 family)